MSEPKISRPVNILNGLSGKVLILDRVWDVNIERAVGVPDFARFVFERFGARLAEMTRLIERYGGIARVSPSMREVAVAENRPVADFAHHVITGQIDLVIFLTGVGVRHLPVPC